MRAHTHRTLPFAHAPQRIPPAVPTEGQEGKRDVEALRASGTFLFERFIDSLRKTYSHELLKYKDHAYTARDATKPNAYRWAIEKAWRRAYLNTPTDEFGNEKDAKPPKCTKLPGLFRRLKGGGAPWREASQLSQLVHGQADDAHVQARLGKGGHGMGGQHGSLRPEVPGRDRRKEEGGGGGKGRRKKPP